MVAQLRARDGALIGVEDNIVRGYQTKLAQSGFLRVEGEDAGLFPGGDKQVPKLRQEALDAGLLLFHRHRCVMWLRSTVVDTSCAYPTLL
jgi:hypothetical protein